MSCPHPETANDGLAGPSGRVFTVNSLVVKALLAKEGQPLWSVKRPNGRPSVASAPCTASRTRASLTGVHHLAHTHQETFPCPLVPRRPWPAEP